MPNSTSIDFGKEVIVLVGKSENRFVCHANLLTAQSPFFEAALSGKWLESKEKLIRLPEQDPTAFSIYLNWRWTGTVDLWDGEDKTTTYTNSAGAIKEDQGPRFYNIIRCSALAEMLQDHAFSNALIDGYLSLVQITNQFPAYAAVNLAFRLLAETSGVRRVLIRQLCFTADEKILSDNIDKLDPPAVTEIATLSLRERALALKDKTPDAKRQSFYHTPPEGDKK